MKLTESLKLLINEIAGLNNIQTAINDRKVCIIYYDGDEPGGRGLREVEFVAVGRSKAGNLVARGWDKEGASHTGYKGEQPLPGWRLFRLDKILSFKELPEVYNEPKPNYNFNGDRSMSSVITIAKFNNNTEQENLT
jgi:predicted DNA-binding transcriptional regulator YafY